MTKNSVCLQETVYRGLLSLVTASGDELSKISPRDASCSTVVPFNVLLAVSGGADSIALMHAAREIASLAVPFAGTRQKPNFYVGHVDHGLRPGQSDGDRRFVEQLAGRWQMEFSCRVLASGAVRQQNRGSLEESARNLRYQLLQEIAVEKSCGFIATAHHKDDQAETILHNVLRGTGLRGLRGMRPTRCLKGGLVLVRPLLSVSQQQIHDYVRQHELPFREDDSNRDPAMTRNRIRHEMMPLLQQHFRNDVVSSLTSLAGQADEAVEYLDHVAEKLLKDCQLELSATICRLDRGLLSSNPDILVRTAMTLIWSQLGWPRQSMSARHWHRLSALIKDARRDATVNMPGGIKASVRGSVVCLERCL